MFTFPKSARLLKSHEYRKVSSQGTLCIGKYMQFYFLPIDNKEVTKSKMGISVPRQYGKAHSRNRFKRYMREIFRHSTQRQFFAIHIKPRPFAKTATLQQLADEYMTLLSKMTV